MSANKKDIDEFDVMFDLSSGSSDENEQAEEYGHSTESLETFDELVKEVSDEVKESDSKGHGLEADDPCDIAREICSEGVCSIPPPEIKEEVTKTDDFFDDLDTIQVVIEEIVPVAEEINSAKLGPPPVDVSTIPTYGEIGSGDDKIEWMLESPSEMYNSFYAKKRDLLFKYMVGGQVEYKRWTQELEEAKVTIRGEVFDHQLIIDQMEAVQQHRERVKAIHVRVNNQYFTFKRFVEMMRGFLARIEYLKPVLKQEGLIMEHMRDIELYYARLEALHDSATKTEKMLAAAFDTLSRKCTICMELKPSERVELKDDTSSSSAPSIPSAPVPSVPLAREQSSEFDAFDDLPSNAQAVPIGHKVGVISWGDI